ncbi:MAG: tetratricopeptide repeat protein, partial [Limisphaerales bacterium]
MPVFSRKHLLAALCLALAGGTIALYWPILHHGFINYDDPDYILNNPHVKAGLTWSGVIWAFTHAYAANWHPITWISHMLDCQLFGLDPEGHHLINVLFHAANAVLLFILLTYMTRAPWRSFFVAALFAWHPLRVESVAWAAERKDVLSGFFWMLALLCYAVYGRNRPLRRPAPPGPDEKSAARGSPLQNTARGAATPSAAPASYWLALLFFACGLMSKPMVVTLPFVLLLLDFWPLRRFSASTLPRLILEKLPFFALTAASCLITMAAQKHALWSSVSLPFHIRLANALMSYVRYISKIFAPVDLALIYPYPHFWPLSAVLAAGAALLALSILFIIRAGRSPYLAVGWFWFLGTLVPVIGLVQVGVQAMADRYTYLPSIGIYLLVAWTAADLVEHSRRKTAACAFAGALALGACIVLTSIQLTYWRSSLSLFWHAVSVTTNNYAADDCLGKTLQNLGDNIDAEKLFKQAVFLEPTYPVAQFDLGMVLLRLGDARGAGRRLATAVALYPSDPVMQYDFGVVLSHHGRMKTAVKHLTAALALNPH